MVGCGSQSTWTEQCSANGEIVDIHRKFILDMEAAGIEWENYNGRYFYSGPAVRTNEDDRPTLQEVIRATDVNVQWDNLGYDWIVYPK